MGSKMNWDRVRWENRAAREHDYSARMDDEDRRAALEVMFESMKEEARRGARVAQSPPKEPPPTSRQLADLSSAERRQLELEAARQGTTPARLFAARTRSTARSTGTVAGGKRARAEAEAKRRGITIEQLKAERRQEVDVQRRLRARADRLGITVKELRRRLASGDEAAEPPDH